MTGANGNAQSVEQGPHIQMMNIPYQKRNDPALVFCLTKDAHSFYRFQTFHGIRCQFVLIGSNLVHSDSRYIIKRFCQCRSTDIIGRSGFKLKRKFIESGFLEADILYHFPSSLIRREFIQPFLLSIEYSYPRRPIYLMPAKCKEICIQVLHVHFHVRYALRTVYQDRDTVTVSRCNHLLHRIHSTEHIANMHQTHQFCTFRKKFLIRIDKQFAFIIHRDNLQHNTSFLSL